MDNKRGCAGCKYHSTTERRKAEGVGDGDLELVAFADEPTTVFMCRHEQNVHSGGSPREMGLAEDNPGVDCRLFEEGGRRSLDPELERLLARRGL